ncbi:MAG: glycosyltransferase, partial [Chloroflexota bacterium]
MNSDFRLRNLQRQYDALASQRDRWKANNRFYHAALERIYTSLIPANSRILELGCGTGDLLAAVKPAFGAGIDVSGQMVHLAANRYPGLRFIQGDAEHLPFDATFDFILLSELAGHLTDIQQTLTNLRAICADNTRLILSYYNFLWEPMIRLGEGSGWKMPEEHQNWLGEQDVLNLLELADFEPERLGRDLILPIPLLGVSPFVNNLLRNAPLVRHLNLIHFVVAKPRPRRVIDPLSCTVVIPCRNEEGNVEAAIDRLPPLGAHTEVIFVDGASTDGTVSKIEAQMKKHAGVKDIKLIHQAPALVGKAQTSTIMLPQGKGDAVRQGFAAARGEVLIILDADLTVPPEDLPKFYEPLASGTGQFVNGTRLVYPM